MKRLLTLLSLPLVLVACDTQPVDLDIVEVQLEKAEKPDRPAKPPKPVSGEKITFTGDLIGSQEVAGCCPNEGPFPEYTLELSGPFPDGIAGTHNGNIFMNSLGRKVPGDYIVQFWWEEEPGNDCFIEIRGGEKVEDKKTKVLTVTFTGEEMTILRADEDPAYVDVSFTLTRAPIG